MPLTKEQIQIIENTIKESLRKKFQTYKPETSYMPFHYRLLGRDRMALFSFIHSLNTTFGTSIAEELWDFLGNDGAYSELLNCFERAGIELRHEIDAYFSKFKQ